MGDQIIGIGSSGLHSNGYSLARKVFFQDLKMKVQDPVEEFGRSLGEELLEPTKIYARTISSLIRDFRLKGVCHITGGGLVDNPPRILPKRCKAVIRRSSWTPHPVFSYIQRAGRIPEHEMMRTFNNGLGMLLVVNEQDAHEIMLRIKAMGETGYHVGWIGRRGKSKTLSSLLIELSGQRRRP